MLHTHVFITGKVQGVWYRDSTRRTALAHGVTGWVRNLDDGRVEAVFEGQAAAVEAVLAWCRRGPELARVEHIERSDSDQVEGFVGFEQRPTVALRG